MAVFGETVPKNSPVRLGGLYRLGNLQDKGPTGQLDEETRMRILQSSCPSSFNPLLVLQKTAVNTRFRDDYLALTSYAVSDS